MKKKMLFVIILCILILTGCWNRKELGQIGLVTVFGLDKDPVTGEIILTTQVLRPEVIKKGAGGSSESSSVEIVTTKGNTISEAISNISKLYDRKIVLSHDKVIIIDEELAKDGLVSILDMLSRSYEIRFSVCIIIAKDTKAKDIIEVKQSVKSIQGTYLDALIKNRDFNSQVSTPDILDFIKKVSSNETNPIAGSMVIVKEPTADGSIKKRIMLSGTAVFKKDKLVGYLNNKETRGLNWIAGKVKRAIVNVPSTSEKDKLFVVDIEKASSTINPEKNNNEISFLIKVVVDGNLIEQQGNADVSKLLVIEEMENALKSVIEKEIKITVDKAQHELNSDIFGFSTVLNYKYPKNWDNIKDGNYSAINNILN